MRRRIIGGFFFFLLPFVLASCVQKEEVQEFDLEWYYTPPAEKILLDENVYNELYPIALQIPYTIGSLKTYNYTVTLEQNEGSRTTQIEYDENIEYYHKQVSDTESDVFVVEQYVYVSNGEYVIVVSNQDESIYQIMEKTVLFDALCKFESSDYRNEVNVLFSIFKTTDKMAQSLVVKEWTKIDDKSFTLDVEGYGSSANDYAHLKVKVNNLIIESFEYYVGSTEAFISVSSIITEEINAVYPDLSLYDQF